MKPESIKQSEEEIKEEFDPMEIFKNEDGMDIDEVIEKTKPKRNKNQKKRKTNKVSKNLRLFAKQLQ